MLNRYACAEACQPVCDTWEGLVEACRASRGGVLGLGGFARPCGPPLPKGFAPLITDDCTWLVRVRPGHVKHASGFQAVVVRSGMRRATNQENLATGALPDEKDEIL
jgi:hypothetical protein